MEFRLVYRGPLVSNGRVVEKQMLRRALHPQMKMLWHQSSLIENPSLYLEQGKFTFLPLVSSRIGGLFAELDILFLRHQRPGDLLRHGGDIDNRLKTLLDSLRVPQAKQNEIPLGESPHPDEVPFYCLLEDDALVTKLTITTDQLLEPGGPSEASVVIHVTVKDRGDSRFLGLLLTRPEIGSNDQLPPSRAGAFMIAAIHARKSTDGSGYRVIAEGTQKVGQIRGRSPRC
jgi:hypothetical protein